MNRTAPARTARLLLAVVATSISLHASPALAQPNSPRHVVTDHNAALLYYSAWLNMPTDLGDALDDTGDGYRVAANGRQLLLDGEGTIGSFLRASRQDHADWGIEYELGPNALLPYLGKLRLSSKILAADALRCAEDGDPEAAAERVGAIYRMADHLSDDHILISSLVGMAMSNFANTIGAQMAADGVLTPEAARALLIAMKGVNLDDPFGLRGAIIGERDIMGNYFIENFDGPDAGARVVAYAAQSMGADVDPASNPIAAMDGEALRRDMQGFRRYYDDVLVVWDKPDASERIQTLAEGIEKGEYGEFAKLMAASFAKSRQSMDRFRKDHTAAIAAMEKIANP